MAIPDRAIAEHYLNFIGYYRLSGYFRGLTTPADLLHQRFRAGTTFQAALDLYIFDRKLRVLLTDALERIEVGVKAVMSNSGALTHGPFWICDQVHFDRGEHHHIMNEIDESTKTRAAHHLFITSFSGKYSDNYPPSWMIMETLSFGAVSRIYEKMRGSLRVPVADTFEVHHNTLQSWLHALTFVRNVCAHHLRLWKRVFVFRPQIPKIYQGIWPVQSQALLYIQCCVIWHMLRTVAPDSTWARQLRELIIAHPQVSLASMGFPADWETQPFWGFV